ncbi:tetratricopeptide repeat protein [Paraneptunicella aestuarii]|uniref:tetratricopeptide repeat protein n=1 Tax=Paraneptunicella aestuarii TaxID=2831148 RepID=UPI001E428D59|nr:tetratricopeptide repeat protein [Paraneptunicella aestuarii]UAA38451.1 tetratricopeptide repeat protein [Paraneptunicella aestuarii]
MTALRLFLFFVLGAGLLGCQSTQTTQVPSEQNIPQFLDLSFPEYTKVTIESPEQIFALNDDAKRFVARRLLGEKDPAERIDKLLKAIFDHSDINLYYLNNANTIAADTFDNKVANCLSMSIMTYALAKEADLNVDFQEVQIPEYWTRRDGYSFLNGHINVRLTPKVGKDQYYFSATGKIVDFYPLARKQHFPQNDAKVNRIIAMFYNNKGADALIQKDFTQAYAYFRSAILSDLSFQSSWTNLGTLYRMTEHYDWAEKTFLHAIKLDENDLTVWENLALLHKRLNRFDKADKIMARIEEKRKANPYYHYILGEEMLDKEEWEQAITHYKRAIRIDNSKHMFYFGLAKSYYGLGDKERSLYYMKKAARNADYIDERERYQGKMDLLASL